MKCGRLNYILYIDDDCDILSVVTLSLEKIGGFSVTTSTSSAAAIILAKETRPDLILLDVMMPLIDGPTLLKKMRAIPELRTIPVIFLTAKNHPTKIRDYQTMDGVAGVICKPFNPLTMPAQVKAMWEDYIGVKHAPIPSADLLRELRGNYVTMLSSRYREIAALLREHESGDLPGYAYLQSLAHNLVGSGKTYGFDAITQAARELEDLLANPAEAKAISTVTKALLGAIRSAMEEASVTA